jgi:hypothetical protein
MGTSPGVTTVNIKKTSKQANDDACSWCGLSSAWPGQLLRGNWIAGLLYEHSELAPGGKPQPR